MSKHITYDSEQEYWSSPDDEIADDSQFQIINRLDWEAVHTDDLLNMYTNITNFSKTTGIPLFNDLKFTDFVDFAWDNSKKYKNSKISLYVNK